MEKDLQILRDFSTADLRCLKVERHSLSSSSSTKRPEKEKEEKEQVLQKKDGEDKKNLSHVYEVRLCRPEHRNAMDETFWREIELTFTYLDALPTCRCILLTSEGPVFTSGLNLEYAKRIFFFSSSSSSVTIENAGDILPERSSLHRDPARQAYHLRRYVRYLQGVFTCIERCGKPVIACIDGPCIGSGVDMICACDIRLSTRNTYFSIKEIDIGLAADVGTLQRLPRLIGHDGWIRELAYTGRSFTAEEAYQHGFLNFIADDRSEMRERALDLALSISSKTPIGILGIKHTLNYTTRRSIDQELDSQAIWNSSMLQTQDIPIAISSSISLRGRPSSSRGSSIPGEKEEKKKQDRKGGEEEEEKHLDKKKKEIKSAKKENIPLGKKLPVFACL
ncbi:enoyl- hydratase isomerase family protein [Cystoisospora suis]|uniref:Enoyl-hydratase isomerase family protein n=1 Tax=Cystoisospora suis TaxID=483139 RepID=A0A2C6KXP0_9APIC|nr:enoyl- hydratase isomerase family protein [Cystoisospora suis]